MLASAKYVENDCDAIDLNLGNPSQVISNICDTIRGYMKRSLKKISLFLFI